MTSKDNPPSQNISRHTPCLVILSFSLLLSKSSHRLSQTEDQRPKTEDAIGRSKQINIVLADFTQIVTFSVFHTNCNQLGISTRIATNPLTLPKYCRWLPFSSKIATFPWYYPNIAISFFFTWILTLALDITEILPLLDFFSSKIATKWGSKQRRVATLNFVLSPLRCFQH